MNLSYALVHGAAHGLGLQAYMKYFGIDLKLEVESDSSSARSFASRKGLGKQRRVQIRFLWLQDRVASNQLTVKKVHTKANVADILTKSMGGADLCKHLETLGFQEVKRSKLQKKAVRF